MRPHGPTGCVFGLLMRLINAPAFDRAARLLAPAADAAVVEIGFGTGDLVRRLARTAAFVAGVDPSPLMVETARRTNAAAVRAGLVDLRQGEAASLPWPDGRFDAACALHSFQFWPHPEAALGEVARVLKPNGRLLLILRAHRGPAERQAWLPNPLAREADEVGATIGLLDRLGWRDVRRDAPVGSSAVILATRPA
jgi:SAM-dependent methyltransferase